MAKNTPAIHKCTIFSSGPRTREGIILGMMPGQYINLKFRKEGSSKWGTKIIPWAKMISYEGKQGEEGAKVSYTDDRLKVSRVVKGSVEFDEKLKMAIINTNENGTIYVKPEHLEQDTIEGVDAPEGGSKKKKKNKKKEK
jgi:hypothetical protein